MTRSLTALAPIASLLIATLVMGSWLDDTYRVIQGCEGCISMKPTTAMVLGLTSISIVMLRLRYDRVASVFAGFALAGIWTVLVYVTLGWDIRLETWAIPADSIASKYQTIPGIPSIGTMIAFTVAATGAMWRAVAGHGEMALCGAVVAGIGLAALIGYATGQPALYWWADGASNAIAINTAAGLVALGAGIVGVGDGAPARGEFER